MTMAELAQHNRNAFARFVEHGLPDDSTVTCPECGGDGGGDDGLGSRWDWVECRRCRGLGYVPTEAAEHQEELDERSGDDD